MSDAGYFGTMDNGALSDPYNLLSFVILQHIAMQCGAELVQVMAVHGGGVSPVGTVDVQPMVNQIDGAGNPTAHGIINGLPFFRLQGGTRAVINDPVAGDIGLAIFSDRDISKVKKSGVVSNPGSFRRNDWADGLYLGSFLGATPTSYVEMTSAGINITDPVSVYINSPVVTTSGNLSAGNGITCSFPTPTGQTVTVQGGIVTNLY